MTESTSLKIYKLSIWCVLILFAIFSIFWMIKAYSYSSIKFLEEIQFFRTDPVYFHNYIIELGGLSLYFSSFITQFYYNPFIGAFILLLTYIAVYFLFFQVCKQDNKNIYKVFSLVMIVPIFLLYVYNADNPMDIKYAHFLGIILALLVFLIYLKIPQKYKLISLIFLYPLLYFISIGNVLLFVSLVIVHQIFQKKKSWWLILLVLLLTLAIPFFSYQFLYITTLPQAYFFLTPVLPSASSNYFYSLGWYSIPALYLLWKIISAVGFSFLAKINTWIIILFNLIIILACCMWGINKYSKHEMEHVMHMAYEVEQGNWDKVIELGNKVSYETFRNAVPIAYFMNIAYTEKGNLTSNMFKYRQTGTYGLYVSWSIHHTTDLYIGELYYRLGVPSIAEQCAFEAMVTSPHEHSSKALRRIVQTSMLRKDKKSFEKYIRLFEKSTIYKSWAKEQRMQFQLFLDNPEYKIPGLPEVATYDNFFFASGSQQNNIFALINYDPYNKKAFEYMAASLLLNKDLLAFHSFMDRYYNNMNYSKLPVVLEEALVILAYNNYEEVLNKYNVSQATVDRFTTLNKELAKAITPKAKKKVNDKYRNTYWIYYQFINPMDLEDIPNMMVY